MIYRPTNPEWVQRLSDFKSLLNESPKVTETSEDGEYLLVPIGPLEEDLNEVYNGAILIEIREQKEMFNHVSMFINLSVFHPVFEMWFKYSGTAAVQIVSTETGRYEGTEKVNTVSPLKTAIASCYSECVKNAAKKIPGKRFGSDLNRSAKVRAPRVNREEVKTNAVTERLLHFISDAESIGQLNEVLTQIGDNEEVRLAFNEKLISLKPIYNGEAVKKVKRTYTKKAKQ